MISEGYRFAHVSTWTINDDVYYATVWDRTSSKGWKTVWSMDETQFSDGCCPTVINGYAVNDQIYFTAIWEKGLPGGKLLEI